jgi:methanogenic corrinoid protein MtbC1
VDEGMVSAHRTAGGHRRILRSEAIRFLRESGTPLLRPELLGLPEVALDRSAAATVPDAQRFFQYLLTGDAPRSRGLLQSLYLSGATVARLLDDLVRTAMHDIGELWQHSERGIFHEHRATDLVIQALHRLRPLLPERGPSAPTALGGALEHDPYLLAPLGAALVLESVGMEATNLGPRTPSSTLVTAATDLRPVLVWVCVSVAEDTAYVRGEVLDLRRRLPAAISLIVGGSRLALLELPDAPGLLRGHTMAELAAFAKGLLATAAGENAGESA